MTYDPRRLPLQMPYCLARPARQTFPRPSGVPRRRRAAPWPPLPHQLLVEFL